jgi:hypothetical protein
LIAVFAFFAGAVAAEVGYDYAVGFAERWDVLLPYAGGSGEAVDLRGILEFVQMLPRSFMRDDFLGLESKMVMKYIGLLSLDHVSPMLV